MNGKIFIMDNNFERLKEWVDHRRFPSFRAKQILEWLNKGTINPEQMTNIPKNIRDALSENFVTDSFRVVEEWTSEKDGTKKWLFELHDGHRIETVLMPYSTGLSVCISSQAGCKMGCSFCASAKAGFGRDLTCGELLAQVTLPSALVNERISRVVIMGIGEPFDNFEQLKRFFRMINDESGPNIGARHITVSTCGLIPQMIEFMCIGMQVNLAVSLHASNDLLRRQLMPIAHRYPLNELIDACRQYVEKTGRRITFEYALLAGVNDTDEQARELARLLRGIHCHINLIAANEFPGGAYKKSSKERAVSFMSVLEKNKMTVTLRREMGSDIMAACGQLRRGMQETL